MTTATKPSYLGLLNAISLGESEAGVYLEAWANATSNEALAETLRFVAAREKSHGEVFCRRISELGFSLLPKPDPKSAERLARYANPRISDLEKIGEEREERDPFVDIERQLSDGVFDPLTAKLMTWYIAEERDSGERLRACYRAVRGEAAPAASSNGASPGSAGPTNQDVINCMVDGFGRLEKSLEKLAKALKS